MTTDTDRDLMGDARSFRLPDEMWDGLVALARRRTIEQDGQPVSVSTLAREAIGQYLGRQRRKGDRQP